MKTVAEVFGRKIVTFEELPKDLFALVGDDEVAIIRESTGEVMVLPRSNGEN